MGFSVLRAAKKLEIPTVSGFHTNFDLYLKHYKLSLIKPFVEVYLKWFHNKTMATFAPTGWMIEELENKGYGNVRRLSRGVDRELFSPTKRSEELRRSWNAGEIDRVLICVSRIAAEKNLDLCCKLFQERIEQGKAKAGVIVGDGPERERLSREYPQLIFPGCLSKADLAEHYASADVFVFPSTTETFGNVVTEALTSGLPVVAYDYAAPAEYIEPGRNGYLAILGNEDSLSSNLDKILRLSGLNLATMGRRPGLQPKLQTGKRLSAGFTGSRGSNQRNTQL